MPTVTSTWRKSYSALWPLFFSLYKFYSPTYLLVPSVLWRPWLGDRKYIRPVKMEWWIAGMIICLRQGADLHMDQLIPLPLTVCCFSKSRLVSAFWYRLTWVVLDKWLLTGVVVLLRELLNSVIHTTREFKVWKLKPPARIMTPHAYTAALRKQQTT